tara:strand:- start:213 stop:518 length:306 start_codon:yes stop_codon:yes gene_type:complete
MAGAFPPNQGTMRPAMMHPFQYGQQSQQNQPTQPEQGISSPQSPNAFTPQLPPSNLNNVYNPQHGLQPLQGRLPNQNQTPLQNPAQGLTGLLGSFGKKGGF